MRTTKEATTAWVAPLLSPPAPAPVHTVFSPPGRSQPHHLCLGPQRTSGFSSHFYVLSLGLYAEISVTWSDCCRGSRGMRGTSESRIWFLAIGLNTHFLHGNWRLLRRMNTIRCVCACCTYFLGYAYVHIHTLRRAHKSHFKNQCNPPARMFSSWSILTVAKFQSRTLLISIA